MAFDEYLKRIERKRDFARNVEFFVMGRAAFAVRKYLGDIFATSPARAFFAHPCMPSFLRPWHNHFDNYGNYIPGYCGGISLGDARHLDSLLAQGVDTDARPILGFLMDEDLEGLFRFALGHGYKEQPAGYYSKCHVCIDVRRHLAAGGMFAELTPREFYEHI